MRVRTATFELRTDFETARASGARADSDTDFTVEATAHFTVSVARRAPVDGTAGLTFREVKGEFGGHLYRSIYAGARLWRHAWGRPWDEWHEIPREDIEWRVGGDESSVRIRLDLPAGERAVVSTVPTWPHSDVRRYLKGLARHDRRVTVARIGRSAGGRPVLMASLTATGDARRRERCLIVAGVHGSEYQGQFAARGMIEWLLSGAESAERLLGGTVFDVVITASPDGNVLNSYHNADDVDLHHFFGEAYEALSAGKTVRGLPPEIVALARHVLRPGRLPSRYMEIHSAWQTSPANRTEPLTVGVIPASSMLSRMIWHERSPFGRTDSGYAAGGYMRHLVRSAAPLENNYRYSYPEVEVTPYDYLPNVLDVPTWVVEYLPGCGVSGNREHGGGFYRLGAESIEAFAGAVATLRRGSDYLVGGLPLLGGAGGGVLADMEAKTRHGGRAFGRDVVGETRCELLAARKKVFDRRAVLGDMPEGSRPFLAIETRTTWSELATPLAHVRFAPSGWDVIGSEFAATLAASGELEMAEPDIRLDASGGVRWLLWKAAGARRGVGAIPVSCGEGWDALACETRVFRRHRLPVEMAISRARVRGRADVTRGHLSQALVLVPGVTGGELQRIARRVADPLLLSARSGAVIAADEWNYVAACGRSGCEIEITNPLRSARDVVLEIRDVPAGSRIRARGGGRSEVQLVPGPGRGGSTTAVVYLPSVPASGVSVVTVKRA